MENMSHDRLGLPPTLNECLFQEDFDNDVDALLEEGMPVPKKMRLAEGAVEYAGDSDHASDRDVEGGVQPMMTKIKTVLKSEWSMSGTDLPCVTAYLSLAHIDVVRSYHILYRVAHVGERTLMV